MEAAILGGKNKSQKLKNKMDKCPLTSSSTNPTLSLSSQQPKTLRSTIFHPLIHLQNTNKKTNTFNFKYRFFVSQKLKDPELVSQIQWEISDTHLTDSIWKRAYQSSVGCWSSRGIERHKNWIFTFFYFGKVRNSTKVLKFLDYFSATKQKEVEFKDSKNDYRSHSPPLTMLTPKKRMMRHKSQPKPVLSGQFMVITLGSPSFFGSVMITTSSCRIPMSSSSSSFSSSVLNKMKQYILCFCSWELTLLLFRKGVQLRRHIKKKSRRRWAESLRPLSSLTWACASLVLLLVVVAFF